MFSNRFLLIIILIGFGIVGVVSQGWGFCSWAGCGGKDKDKDKDKDKGKGKDNDKDPKIPDFFFWAGGSSSDEKRREEGKKNINFLLLNRKNNSWYTLKRNTTSLPKAYWKKKVPLKVLVHGFSKKQQKAREMIEDQKILKIGYTYGKKLVDCNVMVVDWTSLAVAPESQYYFVVESVPIVAQVIAEYLSNLIKARHLRASYIHLVGYGVGAHVAGITGKNMKTLIKKGNNKIARITGLDPAGVGFGDETVQEPKNKSKLLYKTDADFVDVIHCSMGTPKSYQDAKLKGRYGTTLKLGHIDFYPNGGSEQKPCKDNDDKLGDKSCSTLMCPEYFYKSIKGKEYIGCPCQDYYDFKEGECKCTLEDKGQLMGDNLSNKKNLSKGETEKYYLNIDEKPDKPDKKTGEKKSSKKDDTDHESSEEDDDSGKEKKDKTEESDEEGKDKNKKKGKKKGKKDQNEKAKGKKKDKKDKKEHKKEEKNEDKSPEKQSEEDKEKTDSSRENNENKSPEKQSEEENKKPDSSKEENKDKSPEKESSENVDKEARRKENSGEDEDVGKESYEES